jgi:hypothetical protein
LQPEPIEISTLTCGEVELEEYDRLVRGWSLGLETIKGHAKALRLLTTDI